MTQDQLLILLFRIVLISGAASLAAFAVQYTRLAPWWRDAIGATIVIKDVLLFLVLLPSILSLFFHFSRLTSLAAGWFDVAAFGLITPVMIWRMVVFQKIRNRDGRHRTAPRQEEAPHDRA